MELNEWDEAKKRRFVSRVKGLISELIDSGYGEEETHAAMLAVITTGLADAVGNDVAAMSIRELAKVIEEQA